MITYGTNNEFGFDYLKDNMKIKLEDKVQRDHFYAIIDEVDSILIDEARTPLIVSGSTQRDPALYFQANIIAKQLEKGWKNFPGKRPRVGTLKGKIGPGLDFGGFGIGGKN